MCFLNFKNLKMTSFRSKHAAAQLDEEAALSNKDSCVETIPVTDTTGCNT